MNPITHYSGAVCMRAITLKIPIFLFFSFFISCTSVDVETSMGIRTVDLKDFSPDKPAHPVHLLFIHHSTGGALLADKGERSGPLAQYRIYDTNPNGGGLRKLLENNNYVVHEASYGSIIGEDTDICHWNRKFRDSMEEILVTRQQDERISDGTKNKIIIFKSCFPNSWITAEGKEPGDPDSCEKTTANYKAAYTNLLNYFSARPDTLFVVFTAPPLAEPVLFTKDKIVNTVKTLLGRPDTVDKIGHRARSFNNWLKDVQQGWLKDYELNNVVVFDYYDVLTDYGKSNWSVYPTQGGRDSHPSSEGHAKASQEFVPFLNRAVDRMGF